MPIWKPIPGFERFYEISDEGHVRRLEACHPLKGDSPLGYRRVMLCAGKRHPKKRDLVHRLVLAAFVGPPPAGYEVNHKNGDKADNRLENLEYVTRQENERHAYRILKRPTQTGSTHGMSKLTEHEVLLIRALHADGHKSAHLARRFNVSPASITRITKKTGWRHI